MRSRARHIPARAGKSLITRMSSNIGGTRGIMRESSQKNLVLQLEVDAPRSNEWIGTKNCLNDQELPTVPIINPTDVTNVGIVTTRKVSYYGGVYQDLPAYFDVKPEQRPAYATELWTERMADLGYDLNELEELLISRGINGTKNIAELGKGDYLNKTVLGNEYNGQGNLIPGFSIGLRVGYKVPPGSFVYITDQDGNPIGPNEGYFLLSDIDTYVPRRNCVDFYVGNDQDLTNYYIDLFHAGTVLTVQPVEITGTTRTSIFNFISQQPNAALMGIPLSDPNAQSIKAYTNIAEVVLAVGTRVYGGPNLDTRFPYPYFVYQGVKYTVDPNTGLITNMEECDLYMV